MPVKKRCPNEECKHTEYIDYEDKTCTPQPFCPFCMRQMQLEDPYKDGSGDEYEEAY